jgi:hypothetical protein
MGYDGYSPFGFFGIGWWALIAIYEMKKRETNPVEYHE